jgi:hypothetical protein
MDGKKPLTRWAVRIIEGWNDEIPLWSDMMSRPELVLQYLGGEHSTTEFDQRLSDMIDEVMKEPFIQCGEGCIKITKVNKQ